MLFCSCVVSKKTIRQVGSKKSRTSIDRDHNSFIAIVLLFYNYNQKKIYDYYCISVPEIRVLVHVLSVEVNSKSKPELSADYISCIPLKTRPL